MTDVEVRDEDGDVVARWKGSPEPIPGDIVEKRNGDTVFVTARTIRPAGDGETATLEVRAHGVETGEEENLEMLFAKMEERAEAAELELEGLKSGRIRTLEVHRLLEAIVTRQPGALGHAVLWTDEQKKRDAREKKS